MGDKEDLIRKMQGNANLPPAGAAAQAVNPATTPAPFTDGQPWWNGTSWVLPGTEAYAQARAVFCAPATPPNVGTLHVTKTEPGKIESVKIEATVTAEKPENVEQAVQQAAEAAAPKRGRGRPRKSEVEAAISTAEDVKASLSEGPDPTGRRRALAGLAQALIDLGEALAELAE